MLKHTLMGTALAISVLASLAAAPAMPEAPPPPSQDRIQALESELAALRERMSAAIRARIAEVHSEINALHQEGRHDEADHLEMTAREHLEQLHQSLANELQGPAEPDRPMMDAARQLIERFLNLHEQGQAEQARDMLAETINAHIDDPRTPQIMERLIAHLHQSNRPEIARQAEQIFQQAMVHLEQGLPHREQARQQLDDQAEIERMHRHLAELRQAGHLEEARALQRELEQRRRAQEEAMRREHLEAGGEEMELRLRHLHAAVENLHVAGLHEQAENFLRHAEQMQRQFHQERAGRGVPPPEEALPMIMGQIEGLRAEVAELRQIVHQLQRRIDAMGPPHPAPRQPAPPAPAGPHREYE